jgi:glycosyltransferase involved in cell wall biosynthesis
MKIAFVTTFCPHHRIKTFEIISKYFSKVIFFFFSAGDEWYWQQQHGVKSGNFKFEYLRGFRINKTRITPDLFWKLLSGDYDLIIKCINGKFALPIAFIVAKIKRKPFILWTGIWMRLQSPIHRFIFPLTKYLYKHADAIVVYGEHVKRYLMAEGIPSEKIFTTTHAVDNNIYAQEISSVEQKKLKTKLDVLENQKIILYLGRLEFIKGLPYLLDAFSLLNRDDTILVIAGEGSEKKMLMEKTEQLGIQDKVRLTGYVSLKDTLPYYAISTAFILPSITTPQGKETWGLVVNEAFNQGLPVIASDAVGAAAGGLVEDGTNGFIVPERNSHALAKAMQIILDDPDLREKMSQNARTKISTWDNEQMVEGFIKAIEYVTKKKW